VTSASCAFCDIAAGRSAAAIVFEDEISLAFLDARPLFHGHTLLIPPAHVETLGDAPADLVGSLFLRSQMLAGAVETAMDAEGTFVAMNNRVSQSVPHLHIHIVPRRRKDGLRGFFWPRTTYAGDAELEAVRQRIRAAVA
jgi:histidine triad (HIT) family protein